MVENDTLIILRKAKDMVIAVTGVSVFSTACSYGPGNPGTLSQKSPNSPKGIVHRDCIDSVPETSLSV